MGCDIHSRSEKIGADGHWVNLEFSPFDWRQYSLYGFLAGVRNYSAIKPIAEQRGLPEDLACDDYESLGEHSFSWLSVRELLEYDYEQLVEDRRVSRQVAPNAWSGAITAEPGEGKTMTLREFLGEPFFEDLQKLKNLDADRIVFGFDS